MKRLLYISPFAYLVSGADESLLTIIQKLPPSTFKIDVAVPQSSPYRSRYRSMVHRVFGLPLQRLRRSKNPFFWILYGLWFPVEVGMFCLLILWNRYDLVHVNMESSLAPAVAAKMTHTPCVIHYRGKTLDTPAWFFSLFLPTLSGLADRVIAISRASADGFFRRRLTRNLSILHNPVDFSRFDQPPTQDRFAKIRKAFGPNIVTFVGRMDPQKRIVDLIDAAKRLRAEREDFALVIVGGDPSIPEEVEHAHMLKNLCLAEPWIFFLGMEKDVPSILASSSVLVLPSVNEGFGRVVVEAMAACTPVIAARSGALPEVLDEGALGILVKPLAPEHLAKAIDEVLRSPPSHEALRTIQTRTRERYSVESYIERLIEIYESLTRENLSRA